MSAPAVPLSQDLKDEISALNCIYQQEDKSESQCLTGPLPLPPPAATPTLVLNTNISNIQSYDKHHLFLLHPPDLPQPITFKIAIPHDYPAGGKPPEVISLSVEGRSTHHRSRRRRGKKDDQNAASEEEKEEARWLALSRDVMQIAYGQNGGEGVCMYEFVEGMKEVLPAADEDTQNRDDDLGDEVAEEEEQPAAVDRGWVLSETVTEKKSVFVGRACRVYSPEDAKRWVEELIRSDKRLMRATHNMYAYRISPQPGSSVMYQDNDDDGETAAGARLAHLLSIMDVTNVVVVVSRWFGGIKLGGDRFRIISSVGRDTVVRLLGEPGEKEKEKDGKGKGMGKKGKR